MKIIEMMLFGSFVIIMFFGILPWMFYNFALLFGASKITAAVTWGFVLYSILWANTLDNYHDRNRSR